MHLISALLFSISANIDAFVVGLSYGIKKQRIPVLTNLLISLITFAGTLLSLWVGLRAAALIPVAVSQIAGSTLLILLGLYYCFKYHLERLCKKDKGADSLSAQAKSVLTGKEAAFLGLTLTVNNAGMGIGASFAGIHFLLTSFLTLFFCGFFLLTGNRIGSRWAPGALAHRADLLSGVIIIVLGVYELAAVLG